MGLRLALAQGSDAPTNSARRRASSATRRHETTSASGPDRRRTSTARASQHACTTLKASCSKTTGRVRKKSKILVRSVSVATRCGACSNGPGIPSWWPNQRLYVRFFPSSTFISWLPRMQLALPLITNWRTNNATAGESGPRSTKSPKKTNRRPSGWVPSVWYPKWDNNCCNASSSPCTSPMKSMGPSGSCCTSSGIKVWSQFRAQPALRQPCEEPASHERLPTVWPTPSEIHLHRGST